MTILTNIVALRTVLSIFWALWPQLEASLRGHKISTKKYSFIMQSELTKFDEKWSTNFDLAAALTCSAENVAAAKSPMKFIFFNKLFKNIAQCYVLLSFSAHRWTFFH